MNDKKIPDHADNSTLAEVNDGAPKCPFSGGTRTKAAGGGRTNRDWWPNMLNLNVLRQHGAASNPMEPGFNYAEEFRKLDYAGLDEDPKVASVRYTDSVMHHFGIINKGRPADNWLAETARYTWEYKIFFHIVIV